MVWFGRSRPKQGVSKSWEDGRGPVEIHNHGAEPVVISFDGDAVEEGNQVGGQYSGEAVDMNRQKSSSSTKKQQQELPSILCGLSGSAAAAAADKEDESYPSHLLLEPEDVDTSGKALASDRTFSEGQNSPPRDRSPSIHRIREMGPIRDGGAEGKSSFVAKRRLLAALLCILVTVFIIITAILVTRKNSEFGGGSGSGGGGSSSSSIDSVQFSEREARLQEVLTKTSVENLKDTTSAQGMALRWMANEDPAVLSVGNNTAQEIQERFALASLYFATTGSGWDADLGFLSEGPVCTWNDGQALGTFCDDAGSVTSVNIVENNLQGGPIPSDLNYLIGLNTLNLYYNQITGSIPDLYNLVALEVLDVDGNRLSGETPDSTFLLPRLKNLFLLNNENLGGTIPDFQKGALMESISLFGCSFTGTIPSTIAFLSNLRFFQMKNNNLFGTIPTALFADLPALETVGLHGNRLVGAIPPFEGTNNLVTLSLGENQLEALPTAGFDTLGNLEVLYLQRNLLEGTVPSEIVNLPSLRQLWLQENRFSGSIDLSIASESMEEFYVSQNADLEGDLSMFLQTSPFSLEWIDLSETRFSGPVTADISRFSSLKYFNASFCELTGSLPVEIGELTEVRTFGVAGNNLEGEVPTEIGSMTALTALDISRNSLLMGDLKPVCNALTDDGLPPSDADLVSDCGRGGGLFKGNVECGCCTECCDEEGQCAPNINGLAA